MPSLELLLAKVLAPGAAIVLGVAAVAGGQAAGLDVGAAELGGAAIALFLLREVFGFVRWHAERKEPKPEAADAGYKDADTADDRRLEVQREIVGCLNRQTEILERMEEGQASILRVTEQYQATGVCPLTRPLERQATIEAIGREARR